MIVLDASAAVNLLIDAPVGTLIAERLTGERSVNVPVHFDFEVFAAVRKLTLRGLLTAHEGELALDDLRHLTLRRWSTIDLLARSFDLRGAVSTGDAIYVSLAEAIDAPLVTSDRRLTGSNAHHARIEVIE